MSVKKQFCSALLVCAVLGSSSMARAEFSFMRDVCTVATAICEKVKAIKGGYAQRKEIGNGVIDLTKEMLPNSYILPRGPLLDAAISVTVGGLSLALAEKITHAKIPPDCTKPAMVIAKDFLGKTAAPAVLVTYTYMAAVNALAVVAIEERRICDMYRTELGEAEHYRLTTAEIENLNLKYLDKCMEPKDIAKVAEFANYANGLVEKALGQCHG